MQLESQSLDQGLVKVVLLGRLDIAGSAAIDMPLNVLTSGNTGMIVDMSGVDFIASIGIRTLLTCAKALNRRGGGVVLVAPQGPVYEVLDVSGVLELMPVVASEGEARERLRL